MLMCCLRGGADRYRVQVVSERTLDDAGECIVAGNVTSCAFHGLLPFAWYRVHVAASTIVGEVGSDWVAVPL